MSTRTLSMATAIISALLLAPGCAERATPPDRRPIDFEKVITNAKEKVFPALVFVKPISEQYEGGEKQRQQVFVSGVILSPDGYAVTNHHVVDKATSINCVLFDKDQVPATLIGQDKETDLALIKLKWEKKEPLPFAEFADSSALTEGQFVMALGAPFGFTRSISLGILSNTQRYIGFETIYKYNLWLQTDAAINPGNSGGPLVNTDGRIVGINTLGMMFGGMGFSIPSNEVKKIVERLKKDGKVARAWTGMELQALNDFESNTFTRGVADGVLIKGVEEDSPALRAGVKSGDVLLEFAGKQVHGQYVEQLPPIRWALSDLEPGKPAKMAVMRKGERMELELTPVVKGAVEGEDFDCRRWNMTVKDINKFSTPALYFYRKEGVFIRAVRFPGNAADAGLTRQDIILKIGADEVRTVADVKRAYEAVLADRKRDTKVLLTVLRGGLEQLVVLDYRKDYEKED